MSSFRSYYGRLAEYGSLSRQLESERTGQTRRLLIAIELDSRKCFMPPLDFPNPALEQLQTVLGSTRQPKLTDDRFDKAHELFETSSNQQKLILEWLKDFSANQAFTDSLKLLSVGCGSGILDNPLLQALAELGRPVVYTGIDPNAVACDRFRVEFNQLHLDNVQLEVREETVETISCQHSLDIIHAVHSLYYFGNPAVEIAKLLGRVKRGGKLLIFQAPMAELNQLADCFWFHEQDVDIWFSEKLEQHLLESEFVYEKARLDGRIDVARCFDAADQNGSMILDFITQVDCCGLKPDARQKLLDYLTSIAEFDGDKILVPHPVDVFLIDAPPANA